MKLIATKTSEENSKVNVSSLINLFKLRQIEFLKYIAKKAFKTYQYQPKREKQFFFQPL